MLPVCNSGSVKDGGLSWLPFVATRSEHLGDRPGEASRKDLEQAARNAGLSGTSASTKEELKEDLLEHAQQSGE